MSRNWIWHFLKKYRHFKTIKTFMLLDCSMGQERVFPDWRTPLDIFNDFSNDLEHSIRKNFVSQQKVLDALHYIYRTRLQLSRWKECFWRYPELSAKRGWDELADLLHQTSYTPRDNRSTPTLLIWGLPQIFRRLETVYRFVVQIFRNCFFRRSRFSACRRIFE